MTTPVDVVALRKKFDQAGQGHVFRFWDDLTPAQQGDLVNQLDRLDVERVNDVYTRALQGEEEMKQLASSTHTIEPPTEQSTVSVAYGSTEEATYRALGLDAIAAGNVAAIDFLGRICKIPQTWFSIRRFNAWSAHTRAEPCVD